MSLYVASMMGILGILDTDSSLSEMREIRQVQYKLYCFIQALVKPDAVYDVRMKYIGLSTLSVTGI